MANGPVDRRVYYFHYRPTKSYTGGYTDDMNTTTIQIGTRVQYEGQHGTVVEIGTDRNAGRVRVRWDDVTVPDFYDPINRPAIVRVGKRTWVQIKRLS
jgi:hypothetical protein